MLRFGEVQARPARLETENKERRAVLALELFNQSAAVLHARVPVKHQTRASKNGRKKVLKRAGHFPELGEDKRLLLTGRDFGCQLAEALEFAALGGVVVTASKPLRRVVAELLETHEKGKNQAAALNALGGLDTVLKFAH